MDTSTQGRARSVAIAIRLLVAGLLAVLAAFVPQAAAVADDADLVRLAEQAKTAFHRRMEPPPIHINIADIVVRDQTAILRDYARKSYDTAIDALVAEAREPGRTGEVEAALRQLVDTGRGERADAIFSEMLERKQRPAAEPAARQPRRPGTASL